MQSDEALLATARTLHDKGRLIEARAVYGRLLGRNPKHPLASFLDGLAALQAGNVTAGIDQLEAATRIAPERALFHHRLALAHIEGGNIAGAVAPLEQALELRPGEARWWDTLGTCMARLDRMTEAREAFGRALALAPEDTGAQLRLANACYFLKDNEAAAEAFDRLRHLDPHNAVAAARLAALRRTLCDWRELEAIDAELDAATGKALAMRQKPLEHPFLNLLRRDDPDRHRQIAEAWARTRDTGSQFDRVAAADAGATRRRHSGQTARPLRLGYLCGQFHSHPVMQTAAWVMHHHDRSRFTVHGFGYGPPHDDPFRRFAIGACDTFVNINGLGSEQAADRIRAYGIDILIDLTGHTENNRLDILSLRPAPIQIFWLGYVATSGAAYVDYLVSDRRLLPADELAHVREEPAYLPNVFMACHRPPEMDAVAIGRGDVGLPEDAFVFASFNGVKKLNPRMFRCWMEILAETPGSVLWMLASGRARDNIGAAAEAHGIDRSRLIFADWANYYRHLARLACADLALDTWPYGGGVTTANLLLAGVPVVTLEGRGPTARMSASLLASLRLDTLITATIEDYKAAALRYARDPAEREGIRNILRTAASGAALFDPERFTRDFEALCLSLEPR